MRDQDTLAIRERLGAFMASSGATKKSVANSLGISTSTLNAKLKGSTAFTFDQALKLADVMGCKLDDLRERPYS